MEFHELQQIVESNSRAIQSMLDAQAAERERLSETRAIVDSNSRAIQSMLDAQVTEILKHEEFIETTNTAIVRIEEAIVRLTDVTEGIANLTASLDDDRPTILGRLSRIENKVDRLLNHEQP